MPRFHINDEGDDAFERIRGIDTEIKSVELRCDIHDYHTHDEDFGSMGRYISQNKSIEEVTIYNYKLLSRDNDRPFSGILAREWEAFFDGISQSQSIKSIHFNYCDLCGDILKLFDTPNLNILHFECCLITNQTASSIRRFPCLQHVVLSYPGYLNVIDVADFIASLHNNCKLEFLGLEMNSFQEGVGRVLEVIFSDPQSIITDLFITWGTTFSNLLLLNSLSCEFMCNGEDVRDEDWQVVSEALSSPVAALKVLDIYSNPIGNASAAALVSGLVRSNTLEKLCLSDLINITAQGWTSIFSSLKNSNLPLKQILLYNDAINDEVVPLIGEVLTARKDTIERFNLCGCTGITASGWTALSAAFCTPMLNLTEIAIGNENFDDDALVAFANGLCNKPSLRILDLGYSNVTRRGWEAISKALCDASSLEAIRQSNHTLCEIDAYNCPSDIQELLEINGSGSPSDATSLKIIKYSTMESLVDGEPTVQLKLVPSVISLLRRAGNKP
ncbi:hypothetical protein ACHAW6_006235 [Cyclotella cf. meneghiniana]